LGLLVEKGSSGIFVKFIDREQESGERGFGKLLVYKIKERRRDFIVV